MAKPTPIGHTMQLESPLAVTVALGQPASQPEEGSLRHAGQSALRYVCITWLPSGTCAAGNSLHPLAGPQLHEAPRMHADAAMRAIYHTHTHTHKLPACDLCNKNTISFKCCPHFCRSIINRHKTTLKDHFFKFVWG